MTRLNQKQMELTRKAYIDAMNLYEEGKTLEEVNLYLKLSYEKEAHEIGLTAPMLEPTSNSIYITKLDNISS